MRVKVSYIDHDSLTPEDAEARAKSALNSEAKVKIYPDTSSINALSYLAIQKLICEEQAELFFDNDPAVYNSKLPELRNKTLDTLSIVLDRVILDNEEKFI